MLHAMVSLVSALSHRSGEPPPDTIASRPGKATDKADSRHIAVITRAPTMKRTLVWGTGTMARTMSCFALLLLLTVVAASDDLFFAEQLINRYGENNVLELNGLKELITAVGTHDEVDESTAPSHGMECGEDSWIGNDTCLKQMVNTVSRMQL